jgi:hypothetical protein
MIASLARQQSQPWEYNSWLPLYVCTFDQIIAKAITVLAYLLPVHGLGIKN